MEEMDILHKAFFSFEPALFLADLSNIAMDVCADGFDDFERNIHASQQLSPQTKAALSEIIFQTYSATLDSLNSAAANFERYEQLTSLAVPPELFMEQPMPAQLSEPTDPQLEPQLDQELQQLRDQVTQARLRYRQQQQQLQLLDKDISRAASRSAAYKPLVEAVSSCGQPLLEEAAAVSQLAAKLRPMLARARQLQQQQQGEQQQRPLVAHLLSGGDDVAAGDGDAAAGGDGGLADGSKARRMMAEAGVSLQQLQATTAELRSDG